MHDLSLIKTIASGFTAAWVLGLLTQRIGLSPIVGYLLAGVLIGPYTPGYVGDTHIAAQLAEVGVILLMFGVGLHFQVRDLLAVKGVAIPGAIGQSLVATLVAIPVFSWFGISTSSGAVIGMAMAVASTVVLMRVLMDANVLDTAQGHVAVGWLIVEDIFTVVLLVLIPVIGDGAGASGGMGLWGSIGVALLKLGVLMVVIMYGGSWVVPWILKRVANLRSRELFTLTVLVLSIAIAVAAYFLFGASMALGAFLAGMVVARSPLSHQAAAEALPLRDAFAVLFFVSVGMLFRPGFILQHPFMLLAALIIVMVIKPLTALLIVAVLGHSVRTALTVAVGLAQIGEFSFILSELARSHHLMPDEGHHVLVAAAIISITFNPILFRMLPRIEDWLKSRPELWNLLNGRAERRSRDINTVAERSIDERLAAGRPLAVVVGFGPVGRSVHRLLDDAGMNTAVIDMNAETVSELNSQGHTAIYGDAAHESILEQAGVGRASHFVLTLPHSADRAAIVAAARNQNPRVRILVRARYLREREDLEQAGATAAVFEEAEAAVGLTRLVLASTGAHREAVERKVKDLRLQLVMENMSNSRTQHVRSVMVPWSRVRYLVASASRDEVFRQLAQERYSRWPVVEAASGKALGYLLTKDLIAQASADQDWKKLIRPLESIPSDSSIESILRRMQDESATLYLVQEGGRTIGLVTFEDIIEQVVGRIEDEYPHEPALSLKEALNSGGMILGLKGTTREQVLTELAGAIDSDGVPGGVNVAELALARESEFSTDLGIGVAIPHARCPNLTRPLVVFGRSVEGVIFSPQSEQLVYLVFLLVTPSDQPDVQLTLLSQVAALAGNEDVRERLMRAESEVEIVDILTARTP